MISYLELRETSGETSSRDLPQEVRRDGLLLCLGYAAIERGATVGKSMSVRATSFT